MPRMGYNINLGDLGDKYEQAKNWAIQSGADFHLLMTVPNGGVNGAGEVNEITTWKRDLPSHTRIIWRTYSTLEGDWVKMLGYNTIDEMWRDDKATFIKHCQLWAVSMVGRWRAEGLTDVIRDDPSNEPGLDANNRALNERYVIRCVALVNEAHKYGFDVAIGGFSVGTPHEDMIDSGVYDPLLKVVKYFSVHEYPSGAIGAGDLFEYEAMLEPKTVWQRLPQAQWAIAAQYWLLRRCDRLYLRAKEQYSRDVKFIITETNTSEDIPDAHHVTSQLRAKYATADCGGDLRGQQAWQNYYADMFGSNNLSVNVGIITEYMANYVFNVPHIVGVAIFQMGYQWGRGARGRWRCHSYIEPDMAHFNNVLLPNINKNIKGTPMTTPTEIWQPELFERMVFTVSSSIRMRSAMATNSAVEVIGSIDTVPRKMRVSLEVMEANGYKWHKFIEDGKTGYFADLDILRIAPVVDDVPLPPEPPTEPPAETPDAITQEQLTEAVQDAISPLEARIAKLEARLATLLEPVIVDVPDVSYSVPRFALASLASMHEGLERAHKVQKDFLSMGTPEPPLTLTEAAAQGYKPTDSGLTLVNNEGNITISNEPASEVETTLTDEPVEDSEGLDLAS